jgi:hypothetical protein
VKEGKSKKEKGKSTKDPFLLPFAFAFCLLPFYFLLSYACFGCHYYRRIWVGDVLGTEGV